MSDKLKIDEFSNILNLDRIECLMNDINSINQPNLIDGLFSPESLVQTGESGYLHNYDALNYLKETQTHWSNVLKVSGGMTAGGLISSNPGVALVGAVGGLIATELSTPVDRLVTVTEMLLTAFGKEGITVTPYVKTDEGNIDLFVRMSDGRYFAFMLRSKGDSLVKWREDRQEFFATTRVRGGTRITKWSELTKLSQKLNRATLLLKKQKNPLKGVNNAERNKIVIKAIVLTSKTKVDPKNDPSLFVPFGQTTVLRVQSETPVFVLNYSEIINFLQKPEKA
jgi:hypothetical protein